MLKRFLPRLRCDESGATAVEYGLILALIALVIIGALQALGSASNATYDSLRAAITG